MTNSSLISFTKISPNRTSPRNHSIDTITIHCYVGQASVEDMGWWFLNSNAQASSNYGIGFDGSIGMFVEEKDRSWCSSNRDNDNRAVTIECASDRTDPYAINAKVYASLIKLVTDICKRNGIKKLVWSTNKNDRINHKNGCNLTVHRDYANKACPGDYIYNRLGQIAQEVNQNLGTEHLYRVRKSWEEAITQTGAFSNLEYAKGNADKHPGYGVYDETGKEVYRTMAKYCWTNKNGVRIRTGASSKNGEVSWSPLIKGERLEILESTVNAAKNTWYKVRFKKQTGWVWSKLVSLKKVNKATTIAKRAVEYGKAIAADDTHGYDNTRGRRGGKPDLACSSFVARCYIDAGVNLGTTAEKVYTKDMRKIFTSHGFTDVTKKVNLKTCAGMKAGDVLVRPGVHTELYIGSKKMVGARGNANSGKPENGKKGDQTGGEICVAPYSNGGWTLVLRYTG